MTHRTSVALLHLLFAPVCWLGALAVGESAIGAKARRNFTMPRSRLRAAASASCPDAYARPTRGNLTHVNAAIVCLVNRERARRGLGRVHSNRDLGAVAAGQAADMVARGYFGDNSPSGKTAMQRVGDSPYGRHSHGLLLGQNIGWGLGGFATPQAIVAGWMRSFPHRQIILTPGYRDVGAGTTPAAPAHRRAHGATYVLELATRGR